jgi:TldD protein
MTTRRDFLRAASIAAAGAGAGVSLGACAGRPRFGVATATPVATAVPVGIYPSAGDPQRHELALRALEAATSAGATYADVRLTLTRSQTISYGSPPSDEETVAAGVRALVDGAWGFVSTPIWSLDEMTRIGAQAAAQAKANTWKNAPRVDLGPRPRPATGDWVMPVERDPFQVSVAEKLDYIRSLDSYVRSFRNAASSSVFNFERQEKTFASTDGALCNQTLYRSLANSFFTVSVYDPVLERSASRQAPFITPMGKGYELFEQARILDVIPQLYEEALQQLNSVALPNSRYDIVFDGAAMAAIVNETFGAGLELDRALGYEANAGGTSYLAPPERILNQRQASSLVSVTAERRLTGGAATTRWDDDGVEPTDFPLVQDGVVVDYATDREMATVLQNSAHLPAAHSHGCAAAVDATAMPLVRTPNLNMRPIAGHNFDQLVSQVDDGIAVIGGGCQMDPQKLTGQGFAELVYRIRKGKIGPVVQNASYILRSPEFWRSIAGVGDRSTVQQRGFTTWKGQPAQTFTNSVHAPAALVRNQVVIDLRTRQ